VLHEGPVPAVGDDELARVRADFLGAPSDAFAARDQAVAEHDEFVLWFEADVFDQLQVVQILARLAGREVRVELICIGEHLGFARFGGLGELGSEQLAALPAITLSAESFEYATRAWDALRSPDPTALNAIAASRSTELRFVAEAFERLSREYPSTRDGLALSERRLLAATAAGARTREEAFVRAAARETRPFLGDTWAFERLERLAPLIGTDLGQDVLAGRAHFVTDRAIGGARTPGWRWDEGTERIVAFER
jgi:hypothetical protein